MAIVLDGTTGITNVDGSAAAPAFKNQDANTGLSGSADQVVVSTGGSERFRVASAGQLGVAGANYGTSGQVLKSGGASAAPSWGSASSTGTSGTDNFTIADGNLIIGTSGHGIDFSAGAGGDATSNLLDEYEEGTFTSTLKYNNTNDCGFSTSPAGGTDIFYTKIGRLVHVVGYIKGWTMTSGDGSNATMTLPFAVTGGRNQAPGNVAHYTCFNHSVVRCLAEPSSTRLDFFQDNSTSRATWSSGSSNYLVFGVTYHTDT